MATTYERPGGQVRTASGMNILAGLWLVLSPWVLGYSAVETAMWNSVIVGLAVAVMAMIRVGAPLQYAGLSWLNFVLGAWLVISPFVLNFGGSETAMWNAIIVGLIILALSAWSAMATRNITDGSAPDRTDRRPGDRV